MRMTLVLGASTRQDRCINHDPDLSLPQSISRKCRVSSTRAAYPWLDMDGASGEDEVASRD